MAATLKFALVAAVLLILGAGWWWTQARDQPALPIAEAPAPVLAKKEKVAEPVTLATPNREALTPASGVEATEQEHAPASAASTGSAKVADSKATIRARFVDSTGQPWGGVQFTVANEGKPTTTSAADGRAELRVEFKNDRRDLVFQFTATRTGCATRTMRATLAAEAVVDLGEVVLDREARIRGLVHDAGGKGVPNTTVGLSTVEHGVDDPGLLRRHGSMHFDRLLVTHSDSEGRFDLRCVPAGSWRLWGERDGGGYGVSEAFEVKAGEEKDGFDFEVPALRETDSISGVVLDPLGKPVPEANLMFTYTSGSNSGSSGAQCKQDGSFEIRIYMEVPGDLIANDKDHRWGEAQLRDIPPGARDLVLRLSDPSTLPHTRVRVHGPGNEAVRWAVISNRVGRPSNYSENDLTANETEAGLYDVQIPVASFGLVVKAEGYLDSAMIKVEGASPPSELDVELELAPVLRGRVSAAGKPVAGAQVEARREVKYSLTFNGFPCIMNTSADATKTTDADGTFSLNPQGESAVYLRCTAAGFGPTIVGPIRVDGATSPIDIELGPGGAIEGRARSKDGTPLVGAIVGITCGDAHPRTMRSGHDGVFRFDGLAEGQWLVLERDEEFRTDWTNTSSNDEERKIEWTCEVSAGRTTFHDLTVGK